MAEQVISKLIAKVEFIANTKQLQSFDKQLDKVVQSSNQFLSKIFSISTATSAFLVKSLHQATSAFSDWQTVSLNTSLTKEAVSNLQQLGRQFNINDKAVYSAIETMYKYQQMAKRGYSTPLIKYGIDPNSYGNNPALLLNGVMRMLSQNPAYDRAYISRDLGIDPSLQKMIRSNKYQDEVIKYLKKNNDYQVQVLGKFNENISVIKSRLWNGIQKVGVAVANAINKVFDFVSKHPIATAAAAAFLVPFMSGLMSVVKKSIGFLLKSLLSFVSLRLFGDIPFWKCFKAAGMTLGNQMSGTYAAAYGKEAGGAFFSQRMLSLLKMGGWAFLKAMGTLALFIAAIIALIYIINNVILKWDDFKRSLKILGQAFYDYVIEPIWNWILELYNKISNHLKSNLKENNSNFSVNGIGGYINDLRKSNAINDNRNVTINVNGGDIKQVAETVKENAGVNNDYNLTVHNMSL